MTKSNRTRNRTGQPSWLKAGAAGTAIVIGVVVISDSPKASSELANARPVAAISAPNEGPASKATPGQKAAQAAYDAGFRGKDLETVLAVARAESDFRSIDNAGLNSDGSVDYGVFQINKRQHPRLFNRYSWRSVRDNARMAKAVHDEAHGFSPWSSYTSGDYRAHLSEARTLAAGVSK